MIECEPRDNPEVLRLACPLEFRLRDPRLVVPSRKVTVPVGVPAAAVTVAVKVTVCPLVDGLREDMSVVVVLALTFWVSDDDVLDWKFPSPLYTARIVWFPGVSVEVVKVARPVESRVAVAKVVDPSRN